MEEVFIDKSETERIRVGINEYKDRKYVDIRIYYEDDTGDWRPTKKGITLPPDRVSELAEALGKLTVD